LKKKNKKKYLSSLSFVVKEKGSKGEKERLAGHLVLTA
jgi:hypothetical protein